MATWSMHSTRSLCAGLSAEKHAELRLITNPVAPSRTVVEVSVENKRQRYTAGQWVFLCFPQLGVLHWHPFTISSASTDSRLSVHMLCGDRWTGSVRELAERAGTAKVRHRLFVQAHRVATSDC